MRDVHIGAAIISCGDHYHVILRLPDGLRIGNEDIKFASYEEAKRAIQAFMALFGGKFLGNVVDAIVSLGGEDDE